MARDLAPEFSFNVHMDEDHFPDGLCMLHVQKAQQAEQRQLAAAMKESKKNEKAYTAMKQMQDIESRSVSPGTTVGYGTQDSDDARSALSSDGDESPSSKASRKAQKKGGKSSKSGKGCKSKSRSPKATRHRVK